MNGALLFQVITDVLLFSIVSGDERCIAAAGFHCRVCRSQSDV